MYYLQDNNRLKPVVKTTIKYTSRQQHSKVYVLNGAIYLAETSWLLNTKNFFNQETIAYIMPKERSIDIDDEYDLTLANVLINQYKQRADDN